MSLWENPKVARVPELAALTELTSEELQEALKNFEYKPSEELLHLIESFRPTTRPEDWLITLD